MINLYGANVFSPIVQYTSKVKSSGKKNIIGTSLSEGKKKELVYKIKLKDCVREVLQKVVHGRRVHLVVLLAHKHAALVGHRQDEGDGCDKDKTARTVFLFFQID